MSRPSRAGPLLAKQVSFFFALLALNSVHLRSEAGVATESIFGEESPGMQGLPSWSPAGEASISRAAPSGLTARLVDGVSKMIPPSAAKCAAKVVNDLIFTRATDGTGSGSGAPDDEIWRSNSGVVAANQLRLSSSPCLATLTAHFYANPAYHGRSAGASDRLPGSNRPALNARAGHGSFSDSAAGSVYAEAERLSGRRPNLAMALIGYCGHDDIENSVPTIVSFERPSSRQAVTDWMRAQISTTGEPSVQPVSSQRDPLSEEFRTIRNGGRLALSIKCPDPSSSFYAPRAIDESVDIPDELRSRIASIQAPTKGARSLPAKAYHMSFAATTACHLASCGLSSEQTENVLTFLATRYRIQRLRQSTEALSRMAAAIEDEFDLSWSSEQQLEQASSRIERWLQSPSGRAALNKAGASELLAANRARLSWSLLRPQIDAAILYRGGRLGETFRAEPLVSVGASGADPFFNPSATQLGRGSIRQSFCPTWTQARCNAARMRVDTWRSDLDWTSAQQSAGAKFGHKRCSSQIGKSADAELEAQACGALRELQSEQVRTREPAEDSTRQ